MKSGYQLVIPSGATLKLNDSANIVNDAFGGIANAVIMARGKKDAYLTDIKLEIDGVVDGNKSENPYESGGCEGVNFAWVKNSVIQGEGVIKNANGDGIDLDAVENVIVLNLTVENNGGSGVHFGAPRPIVGSIGNLVHNVTSIRNGFRHKRNGFDLTWANPNGASFINCTAIDNYRNFEMNAVGGAVIDCNSVNNGSVQEADEFSGASIARINGKEIATYNLISEKTKILLKRDIKLFFGMDVHEHLIGLEY